MEQVRLCCLAHVELAWLILEPDTRLEHCPRILLSGFRARTSASSLPHLRSFVPPPPLPKTISELKTQLAQGRFSKSNAAAMYSLGRQVVEMFSWMFVGIKLGILQLSYQYCAALLSPFAQNEFCLWAFLWRNQCATVCHPLCSIISRLYGEQYNRDSGLASRIHPPLLGSQTLNFRVV